MEKLCIHDVTISVKWIEPPIMELLSNSGYFIPKENILFVKCFEFEAGKSNVKIFPKTLVKNRGAIKIFFKEINKEDVENKLSSLLKYEILSYDMKFKGNLGIRPNLYVFEDVKLYLLERDIKTIVTNRGTGHCIDEFIKTINFASEEKLRWIPELHHCFDNSFQLIVKELLLITKIHHWYLPKYILLYKIIPLLADFEQRKYNENLNQKEISFSYKGVVSTTGMVNVPLMNAVFYYVKKYFNEIKN